MENTSVISLMPTEPAMITVLVRFKLPQPISTAQAKEIFLGAAPKYLGMLGLTYCF
jgi:hypothetical protein